MYDFRPRALSLLDEQSPFSSNVTRIVSPSEGGGDNEESKSRVLKHLLAGGVAGAVSRTAVSPLERVKILLQLQRGSEVRYTGFLNALKTVYKEEGFRGLLKGNGTNVIRIFPYSAVQFAAYERYKKLYKVDKDSGPFRFLSAGASAGITSVVATYPLDLIRTRLSSSEGNRYKGIWFALVTIWRQEGVLALYKGITATVLGIAPYVGLNFTTYELLKRVFIKQQTLPPPVIHLTCGAVAGAVSQTVTYPLDVLRRRMQMQAFGEHPAYGTSWNCMSQTFKNEGVRGFYKGMLPNYLKVVPSISITFLVYEWTKRVING